MSSLRRGHANLLCIVPILADDLFRGSDHRHHATIKGAKNYLKNLLCKKVKTKLKRGRAGIEPATSPTRRENHTSRPTAQASNEDRTRDLVLTRHMLCQLSYRGESRLLFATLRREKANLGSKLKSILDGIRTRNPQIRSLMRYPLRHEYLLPLQRRGACHANVCVCAKQKSTTSERFELPRESSQLISNQSP